MTLDLSFGCDKEKFANPAPGALIISTRVEVIRHPFDASEFLLFLG
jgi:hypothetical protein